MFRDVSLHPAAGDIIFAEHFRKKAQVVANGGTITGTPAINQGFQADGTSYITYNRPYPETGVEELTIAFTLEGFSTPTAISGFAVCRNATNTAGWDISSTATHMYFVTRGGGGRVHSVLLSTMGIDDGGKHRVMWTINASESKIYVDGVEKGSTIGGIGVQPVKVNMKVGIRAAGEELESGVLSDFIISSRFRTAQEAEDDYTGQTYHFIHRARGIWPMKTQIGSAAPYTTPDIGRYGFDLTLGDGSNPATFPAKLVGESGFEYDGGDWLTGPDIALPTDDFAISTWVDGKSPGNNQRIFYHYNIATTSGFYLTFITNYYVRFYCYFPATFIASDAPVSGRAHIVGVRRSGRIYLWINGVEQSSNNPCAASWAASENFYIGCDVVRSNRLTGIVKNTLYFYESITPTQIRHLYNLGPEAFRGI